MKNNILLPAVKFVAGVLPRRSVSDGGSMRPEDPAVLAVTDFTREPPATVEAERQIDAALSDMITLGVRALLVYQDKRIVGLITSYDIQGERPLQFLQSSNYRHHRDIRVVDVMTPWESLRVLDWHALQLMHAGDLLQLLTDASQTHVIVVEPDGQTDTCAVRALVSRARLVRQLGAGAGNNTA